MARTLILTLAVTVAHLEGDALDEARYGSSAVDGDYPEDVYPAGNDTDLDETTPFEIGQIIADMLPQSNDEMWAGSAIFASVTAASVSGAEWAK